MHRHEVPHIPCLHSNTPDHSGEDWIEEPHATHVSTRNNTLGNRQEHVDIASGRIGVRTDLMRLMDQILRDYSFDTR
jgi:hypothetical protein